MKKKEMKEKKEEKKEEEKRKEATVGQGMDEPLRHPIASCWAAAHQFFTSGVVVAFDDGWTTRSNGRGPPIPLPIPRPRPRRQPIVQLVEFASADRNNDGKISDAELEAMRGKQADE